MPELIINADDFGQAPGICRAIAELHDAGALTSATLMANGVAFAEAVDIAKARPKLGVGCHVVLLDGEPVLPASEVRSLLAPGRNSFIPSLSSFVWELASGVVREDEIEREAIAQIQKLQDAGIDVTHVDTHKHTHMFPKVLRAVTAAVTHCGVRAIRNSFEQEWSLKHSSAPFMRMLEVRGLRTLYSEPSSAQVRAMGLQATDGCVGVAATGTMTAEMVEGWLTALPEGRWEIACHPGYCDEVLAKQRTRLQQTREQELQALLNVVPPFLKEHPQIRPISFLDV